MPRIIFNLRPSADPLALIKKAKASAHEAGRAVAAAHVAAHQVEQRLAYGIPPGTETACSKTSQILKKIIEAQSTLLDACQDLDDLAAMAKR